MEIRGLQALVTGASGFIGGRLSERLVMEGEVRVRALVRSPDKASRLHKLPLEIVKGDLLDVQSLRKAVQGCDLIFHCAAIVREGGDRKEFMETNVEGTQNILKVSSEAGVKRFIHFSSVAVYGLDPPDGADEGTPYQPCGNLYCDTKIEAEKAVWDSHRKTGLPVVVIRPANVYGPYSNPWTIRPIELINSGLMILINRGAGLCNYVFIDNLLDATLAATKRDASLGEVYLISDGATATWKQFFGFYAEMAGKRAIKSVPEWLARLVALGFEGAAMLSGRPPKIRREGIRFLTRHARFSIEKAKRDLNYQPRISLEEGMKVTEQWLRVSGYLPRVEGSDRQIRGRAGA
jgi:nucleoside-diphosphate-sugar epimerase